MPRQIGFPGIRWIYFSSKWARGDYNNRWMNTILSHGDLRYTRCLEFKCSLNYAGIIHYCNRRIQYVSKVHPYTGKSWWNCSWIFDLYLLWKLLLKLLTLFFPNNLYRLILKGDFLFLMFNLQMYVFRRQSMAWPPLRYLCSINPLVSGHTFLNVFICNFTGKSVTFLCLYSFKCLDNDAFLALIKYGLKFIL